MMPTISEYERLRQENIEQNRKVLKELGLLNPLQAPIFRVKSVSKAILKKRLSGKECGVRKKRKIEIRNDASLDDSLHKSTERRHSNRLRGNPVKKFSDLSDGVDEDDHDDDYSYSEESDTEEHYSRKAGYKPHIVIPKGRENVFGEIPNVPVGKFWMMRIECSFDGIHRPLVAGIHGNQEGCYSIALSGGYEDDLDYGEWFTYTGSGGRDLKGTKSNPKNLRTAPQSKDQTFFGANLSLSKNVESKKPVRVIRGFKLKSPYAPPEGYRYDGLYTVERFWLTTGLSGFKVYKFALMRCKDQEPAPWSYKSESDLGEISKKKSDDFKMDNNNNDAEECEENVEDTNGATSEENVELQSEINSKACDLELGDDSSKECEKTVEESQMDGKIRAPEENKSQADSEVELKSEIDSKDQKLEKENI